MSTIRHYTKFKGELERKESVRTGQIVTQERAGEQRGGRESRARLKAPAIALEA